MSTRGFVAMRIVHGLTVKFRTMLRWPLTALR